MDKGTGRIICVALGKGRKHDFRLFKESRTRILSAILSITDSAYQGIAKLHAKSLLPKKNTKKNPLTKQEKAANRAISSQRVLNENVIAVLKRFRILADKYRNRRKRFSLRFNLISGICNYELIS